MEDLRKGKRSGKKKDFQRLTHTCMEEIVKKPWYIIRREKRRKRTEKKRERKKKRKKKRLEYSEILVLGHVRGYFLYRYMRITLSF